jgi:hypothetical protein
VGWSAVLERCARVAAAEGTATALTLDQAWRLLPAVKRIARFDERPAAGHRRSSLAIAAGRAANEAGVATAAAAIEATTSPRAGRRRDYRER